MNEDDFLIQQRKSPRREFATDLYQRINKPMFKQAVTNVNVWRRPAVALGTMMLLLVATLLLLPAVRTFAGNQVRQIGAILLRADDDIPDQDIPPTIPAPVENSAQLVDGPVQAAELAGFTVLAPTYLPEEYSESEGWSVQRQESGVYVVATYDAENGRHFLIMNQTQFANDALFEQRYGENETVTDVMVGEHPGVFINGRFMTHPNDPALANGEKPELLATNWLIWEANGITYTLFADDLHQDELIRIAKSLSS